MRNPFLIFFLACICFVSLLILPTDSKPIFDMKFESNEVTYCFYSDRSNEKINSTYVVESGIYNMFYCENKNVVSIKKLLKSNLFGESISIKNATKKDIEKVLKKANDYNIFFENFDNLKIYYCYNCKFPKYVILNDKKVNLQIAFCENNITMGYPIILGEY